MKVFFSGREELEQHELPYRFTEVYLHIWCLTTQWAARPRNMTMLLCYAPTAYKSDENIELFCREVDQVLAQP